MIYWLFTIDGDWEQYFDSRLPEANRRGEKTRLLQLVDHEIRLARIINGKIVHFVHTSPLARDLFLAPEFIVKWRTIEKLGGSVGVHCHEEELYKTWHCNDRDKMLLAVSFLTNGLRKTGLSPQCYRGGFMTFSEALIPILEQNGLFLDCSCEPGRHLEYNNVLVSDWQGAPDNFYRLDYHDKCKQGKSQVFEIPLGIYIERQSLRQIWQTAKRLSQKEDSQVLSVLAHTYDYASWKTRLKIKLALSILKMYGKFVNVKEALEIVRGCPHPPLG